MPKNQLVIKNNREHKLKNRLEIAKIHAISKDGECLSTEYINTQTKLEWKCNNIKHTPWFSNYSEVINKNSWCPKCNNDGKRIVNGLEIANHNG